MSHFSAVTQQILPAFLMTEEWKKQIKNSPGFSDFVGYLQQTLHFANEVNKPACVWALLPFDQGLSRSRAFI